MSITASKLEIDSPEPVWHENSRKEPRIYWWMYCMTPFPDNDKGVPPYLCESKWCPLHHDNPYFNDNDYVRMIGPLGYENFDIDRKLYFGLASWFTIISMAVTISGCFALSTSRQVVQNTYWAGGSGYNSTSETHFTMYVGLRSIVNINCEFETEFSKYPSSCSAHSVEYSDPTCLSGAAQDECVSCSSIATSMWLTAFLNCAGMILALLGAQTRMRIIADVPVQKMLGMYADAFTAASLSYALFTFRSTCLSGLDSKFNKPGSGVNAKFYTGPGVYAYGFCVASAVIRAILHWLTPLPGQGAPTISQLFDSRRWRNLKKHTDESIANSLKEPVDAEDHTTAYNTTSIQFSKSSGSFYGSRHVEQARRE